MNVYHYSSEPLYQHPSYQQCSLIVDHPIDVSISHNQFEPPSQNVNNLEPSDSNCEKCDQQSQNVFNDKSKIKLTSKAKVDTSNFSIEERLLAAVWVHERKRTRSSISEIRREFQQRFGREPPAKNTLLVWERKLFSTGSVCDAPRPGRPINRRSHMDEVVASIKSSPSLSLRARALALRLPRSTLRSILHKDLPQTLNRNKDMPPKNIGKQQAKRRSAKQIKKTSPVHYASIAPPVLTAPVLAPAPEPSALHTHDYI